MIASLRKLWLEPRRSALRNWIFQVHTWAGVGAGLYLALMGLTGATSVFLPELRNSLTMAARAPTGTPRIPLQLLQARIEAQSPSLRPSSIYPGQTAAQSDLFEEVASDKSTREIVIDPYDGHIMVNRKKGATFYDWVRDLHANLLNGTTGKTINGFGGILLLFAGFSGLVIWWPGRRHLSGESFKVSGHKGWHRLSFDLHRLVGALIVIPLLVAATTGISLAFPRLAGRAVAALLGPQTKPLRSDRGRGHAAATDYASLDAVREAAQKQLPGAILTRIQAPSAKNNGFVAFMRLPGDWRLEGDNRVLLDAQTAKVRQVQLGRQLSPASRVLEGATSVHYGQWGGTATRVFAVEIGLTLPFLFATGMLLWWRRILRRRLDKTSFKSWIKAVSGRRIYANETP